MMIPMMFTPLIAPAILALIGTALSAAGAFGTSALNRRAQKKANEHLTGKEQEQNAFNAQQAQINRDYETEMSNTSFQRQVADMQAAGVNPALAMNSGSNGASTPSGSNAQGSASLMNVDVPDFQSIASLAKLPSEIALAKSQANLNDTKAEESKVTADQIVEQTKNIIQDRQRVAKQIEGMSLDNEQKEILLKYADETEKSKLANLQQDYKVKEKEVEKFNAEISKMSEEQKKIVQETINLQEQVRLMMSQETLNYEQAKQCSAMIGQINENTALLQKDNSHYDFNHMKTLSFKDGVAVVSDENGAYSGSFTGASAAIRPNGKRAQKREEKRKKKEDRW